MGMNFEELDAVTRRWMQVEFDDEESGGSAYRGKGLSPTGKAAFPGLMQAAIREGDEETLSDALMNATYWEPTEQYVRNRVVRDRQVNVRQAAERLSLTEFNTWYVRGLARRLMDEGVTNCQAYRAAAPKWEPAECSQHEGQIYEVRVIYVGHRVRYWPEPGTSAISIPYGPGCHHTIRRVR